MAVTQSINQSINQTPESVLQQERDQRNRRIARVSTFFSPKRNSKYGTEAKKGGRKIGNEKTGMKKADSIRWNLLWENIQNKDVCCSDSTGSTHCSTKLHPLFERILISRFPHLRMKTSISKGVKTLKFHAAPPKEWLKEKEEHDDCSVTPYWLLDWLSDCVCKVFPEWFHSEFQWVNEKIPKVFRKTFSIDWPLQKVGKRKKAKKSPWLGFEPQTWKRRICSGTGSATVRCRGKEGKRPMTAHCLTQCSDGCSLGSLLFLRQDNHIQRCLSWIRINCTGQYSSYSPYYR